MKAVKERNEQKKKNQNKCKCVVKGVLPQVLSWIKATLEKDLTVDLTKLRIPLCIYQPHAAHVGLLPLKSSYMIPNNCLA